MTTIDPTAVAIIAPGRPRVWTIWITVLAAGLLVGFGSFIYQWSQGLGVTGLSNTPRVYLIPAGADVLRSPNPSDFTTREWNVVDQVVPVPFPVGEIDLQNPDWIPLNDSLSGELGASRRFARFRAYHDAGFNVGQMTVDSRLIGRSVWNNEWILIIPGETLKGPTLADKLAGLETFLTTVSDVKLFFQTYSYPGN